LWGDEGNPALRGGPAALPRRQVSVWRGEKNVRKIRGVGASASNGPDGPSLDRHSGDLPLVFGAPGLWSPGGGRDDLRRDRRFSGREERQAPHTVPTTQEEP